MSEPLDVDDLPAQQIAQYLLSGEAGLTLYSGLHERFPAVGRDDLYFGVALAFSEMAAGLVAAECELRAAQRQLEGRRGRRAAA